MNAQQRVDSLRFFGLKCLNSKTITEPAPGRGTTACTTQDRHRNNVRTCNVTVCASVCAQLRTLGHELYGRLDVDLEAEVHVLALFAV
jgi:hypothetical protein